MGRNCSYIFIVLCFVSQFVWISRAEETVVYVLPTSPDVPDELSRCPTSECYSLKELRLWQNFTSNTTIVLLPGTHAVSEGNDSGISLDIESIQDFSIIGRHTGNSDNAVPKIQCFSDGTFQITFHNIIRLTLNGFEIQDCSVNSTISSKDAKVEVDQLGANIKIADSCNTTIERVTVYHGNEVGLLMLQVYDRVAILHSEFSHNAVNCYLLTREWHSINITITDTEFKFGKGSDKNSISSGLTIDSDITTPITRRFEAHIINVTLHENRGGDGNLNIFLNGVAQSDVYIQGLISTTNNNCSTDTGAFLTIHNEAHIHISDSYFLQSSGVQIIAPTQFKVCQDCTSYLKNITIDMCTCGYGLSFWHVENVVVEDIRITNSTNPLSISRSSITIQGECFFQQNREGAVLDDESTLKIGPNSVIQFENNTCFTKWSEQCATLLASNSNIYINGNSRLLFRNNNGSSSGAITLIKSNIHILDNVSMVFDSNSGTNGGAISLHVGSQIILCDAKTWQSKQECASSEISVEFINNYATGKGGAVYLDNGLTADNSEMAIKSQFIVVNFYFYFINNTADIAGNALYGGWLSYTNPEILNFDGQQHDLSTVASNPFRVCKCVDVISNHQAPNNFALEPNCTISEHRVTTYPGRRAEIKAVAVGQGYGTVPSTVHATLLSTQNRSQSTLNDGDYAQTVHRYCTTLHYTVHSVNKAETIMLTVDKHNGQNLNTLRNTIIDSNPHLNTQISILMEQLSITVVFKDCPAGFSLNYTLKKCSCHPTLLEHQINDCDFETLKILKPSQKWINATYVHTEGTNITNGVIVHDHCPFDYCIRNTPHVSLHMDNPDDQCDFNRSGILCGACLTNFSHVLGTSRCKKCSDLWALLLVPAIALLGIALVISLISLNLTVSIGMINGLIFYANIVRANHATFFHSNTFLSEFVAWLNLDLGFEVCFYNGLDAYTKTWLQLLFPMYIWALVLTIIMLSRHYTFAARLSGTNAVQVLATLFLLSYAKLIRTIITILQPTMLVYPDGFQRRVWLYDGNMDYLKEKHIPLFIVALLVLVCLSIPYTTSLLFIHWLRKYNHHRLLRWVGKLKPLFDAYTGPLKEKHCYWFGLLLLVRVALYVVFSLNVSGNTSVNLMAIGTTTSIMFSYLSLAGGVYESRLANLMLVSFLLNLIILTMGTGFYGNTQMMSATSVGIAFSLFVFIILYHIYLRVSETQRGKQINETLKSKTEQLFSSQTVIRDIFYPTVATPTPVTHSSIKLQESLLEND